MPSDGYCITKAGHTSPLKEGGSEGVEISDLD